MIMIEIIINPSSDQIKNLPLTEKEVNHKSRQRLGYHVYSSYLFYAFHRASVEEKEDLLIRYKVWRTNEDKDDASSSSSSSSSSVRIPSCHDVSRFAGLVWRSYGTGVKDEWANRATMLNSRARNDGRFIEVPDGVMSSSIEKIVKESLTQEWLNFVQLMRNAFVLRRNQISSSMKIVTMGLEKVNIGLQVCKKFTLSPLLRITVFGSPLFCKLHSHELSYRSKKVVVIHIHSHQRMNELLTFGGVDASTHYNKGMKIRVCPKVSITDAMGRSATGYVLNETATHLGVRVEGSDAGELDWVQRVVWDSVSSQYLYCDEHDHPLGQKSEIFYISYFWPIRITLNLVTGHSYLITSQCTCNHLDD